MIKNERMIVKKHTQLANRIFELTLQGTLVQEMNQPGQFVHVRVGEGNDPLLRRPISICTIDKENSTFTMIYRTEGEGTKRLSTYKEGEEVDVLGPLGKGFPVEEAQEGETALLVGGGIGVPPLYELGKRLVERGVKVVSVLGFQNAETVFYEEAFAALGDVYIATVDGSKGYKGFVTDVIEGEGIDFDIFYSCGPTPMLKALEQRYENDRGYISLEERMACGVGACFACVCHKKDDPTGVSYRKVCSDGPVFAVGEVKL